MFNKYRRFVAFVIDMFIVSALALLISSNYNYNPNLYDMEDAYKELESIQPTIEDISSINNIDEYISNIAEKTYAAQKSQIYVFGWYLLFYFLYFVIFAYFTEGQTLGKRFTKLKIVKKDGSRVGILNLLLRSITNGSSLFLGANISIILNVLGIFIFSGNNYYAIYSILVALLGFAIELINIVLLASSKNDCCLNDKISRSEIIVLK